MHQMSELVWIVDADSARLLEKCTLSLSDDGEDFVRVAPWQEHDTDATRKSAYESNLSCTEIALGDDEVQLKECSMRGVNTNSSSVTGQKFFKVELSVVPKTCTGWVVYEIWARGAIAPADGSEK